MILSDAWAGNLYDNFFTDEKRNFVQEFIEITQTRPPKTHGIVPTPAPHPSITPYGTPIPK